jgi:hypothetical protein
LRKSIIYFTKKPIPSIPKNQGKYGQMIYLSKTTNKTYKTKRKISVLKVKIINTLALCQIIWKIVSTSTYFLIICFLSITINKDLSFMLYALSFKLKLFSFFDRVHFLLFLQEFLHSSFDNFLDYFIFVECWMTLITSFHFKWTRNCSIYGKFSTTDTVNIYIFKIISMYSCFHW